MRSGPTPAPVLRAHDLDPDKRPRTPTPAVHRGLALRPADAVDPYVHGRFAPDVIGIEQLAIWCAHCTGCLTLTTVTQTDRGLFVEGVCHTCGSPATGKPGIYKRFLLPLAWGKVPAVEED